MTKAVSIIRCADYLSVTTKQVRAAIELGLVAETEHTVVPQAVFEALVKAGVVNRCPCCEHAVYPDGEGA